MDTFLVKGCPKYCIKSCILSSNPKMRKSRPKEWTDLQKSILEKDSRPEESSRKKEPRSYSQPMFNVLFCEDNNVCSQDMLIQKKKTDHLWGEKIGMCFFVSIIQPKSFGPLKWNGLKKSSTSGYLNGRILIPF